MWLKKTHISTNDNIGNPLKENATFQASLINIIHPNIINIRSEKQKYIFFLLFKKKTYKYPLVWARQNMPTIKISTSTLSFYSLKVFKILFL